MLQLLLLAVVAAGLVNGGPPCDAPRQMTFRAHRHDFADTYYRRYYSEYDRDNERVVMFEEDFAGGHREIREFLFLHAIDAGFEFNFTTKQCRRFRAGRFFPFGVPFNSTYEGEFVVGGPDESVTVDRWSDRIPQRRESWVGEFSLGNCYPISQFRIDEQDFNRTSISHFYDVVEGISDPNDFNIPTQCAMAPFLKHPPIGALRARALYTGTWRLD